MGSGRVVAAISRPPLRTAKTLPSSVEASSWASSPSPRGPRAPGSASSSSRATAATKRSARGRVGDRRRESDAVAVEDRDLDDLRGDLGQVGERLSGIHARGAYCAAMSAILRKFFADRGTHLAAMIAYFALLSFVPLLFLSLALLGTAHQDSNGSFFVRELQRTFPSTSLDSILDADARRSAPTRPRSGSLGGGFLLWSSLSLFSVLESAFNIVYDRPNRPFLRGKALASADDGRSRSPSCSSRSSSARSGSSSSSATSGSATTSSLAYVLTRDASRCSGCSSSSTSAYVVLTNAALVLARGAARGGRRRDPARGDLPVPAGVRPRLQAQPGAADALGPGGAARLAVRDGERDRARRRGQLVPPATPRGCRR